MQAISGSDPADATSLPHDVPDMLGGVGKGVRGLRIGHDELFTFEDMDPAFAQAVFDGVKTLERLGARIVPVRMPDRLREYLAAWPIICSAEAAAAHATTYPSRAEAYGPWFRGWLERGTGPSAIDYARAHELRLECNGELRRTMREVDLLASPATAQAAYAVTPEILYGPIPSTRDPWISRYTVPHNFAGLPTISLPAGMNGDGLPVSLQLAAHHLSEPLLIQVAAAFEDATEFHSLHPPV
jgi:amidase